ncbi:MAG: HTTM domain-containing protein [Verrucomicrobiota bacterium]
MFSRLQSRSQPADEYVLPPPDAAPWIRRVLGIDVRSLAVFRIAFGLILIVDLIFRASDLGVFYTDAGVLPREEYTRRPWQFSLHLLSGSAGYQAALFAIAGLAAFAMMVGHRARLAAVVSFVLLCSLHNRNPYVLQAGDTLLRVMHLWILFLPIGACWSIDAWRRRGGIRPIGISKSTPNLVISVASAAALLQIASMYWFTAMLKSDPIWRQDGLAIYYALNVDQFSTPFGLHLLNYPTLLKVLTHATFWLEVIGPILAFLPFSTAKFRMIAICAFMSFHFIGLRLTMELGLFSYTGTAVWLLFLPREFWDRWLPEFLKRIKLGWNWLVVPSAATDGGPVRSLRWIGHCWIVGLLFIYATAWNVRTCDFDRYAPYFPTKMNWIGYLTGARQHWNMFAPKPMTDDGWYVFPAQQVNGNFVDLLTGEPVHYDKPELVSATYKNQRWRKYMMNLRNKRYQKNREPIAKWMMDQWNAEHFGEERVVGVQLIYMRERTTADGKEKPRPIRMFEYLPFSELAAGENPSD